MVETDSEAAMETVLTEPYVSRDSDLSMIRSAIARMWPGATGPDSIGLMDVAEACRTHARASIERDCHVARDALLTIACEWDLARDRLEDQSDACVAAIVGLLR
jgi:hypothetical protein